MLTADSCCWSGRHTSDTLAKRRSCMLNSMWFSLIPWMFDIHRPTRTRPFDPYR